MMCICFSGISPSPSNTLQILRVGSSASTGCSEALLYSYSQSTLSKDWGNRHWCLRTGWGSKIYLVFVPIVGRQPAFEDDYEVVKTSSKDHFFWNNCRLGLTRSLNNDVYMLLEEFTLTLKHSANSPSRVQCIVIIQLDVPKLFFVRTLNLHSPKIEGIDIDSLELVGVLRFILCLFPLLVDSRPSKMITRLSRPVQKTVFLEQLQIGTY